MSSGGRPTAERTRSIVTRPALGTLAAPTLASVAVRLHHTAQHSVSSSSSSSILSGHNQLQREYNARNTKQSVSKERKANGAYNWMLRHHSIWLQTCDVYLTCRPDVDCVCVQNNDFLGGTPLWCSRSRGISSPCGMTFGHKTIASRRLALRALARIRHSVTCHHTQQNVPRLKPSLLSQVGWYSTYLAWKDERPSWPGWLVIYRDGSNRCSAISLTETNALTTTPNRYPISSYSLTTLTSTIIRLRTKIHYFDMLWICYTTIRTTSWHARMLWICCRPSIFNGRLLQNLL